MVISVCKVTESPGQYTDYWFNVDNNTVKERKIVLHKLLLVRWSKFFRSIFPGPISF